MPYIKRNRQEELSLALRQLIYKMEVKTAGELAFMVTTLALEITPKKSNYNTMASTIGILETVKLEFYRRMLSPYEDIKKELNGDVFPK